MEMAVLWFVAPCSLVEVHRSYRGACFRHSLGRAGISETSARLHVTATHKTAILYQTFGKIPCMGNRPIAAGPCKIRK